MLTQKPAQAQRFLIKKETISELGGFSSDRSRGKFISFRLYFCEATILIIDQCAGRSASIKAVGWVFEPESKLSDNLFHRLPLGSICLWMDGWPKVWTRLLNHCVAFTVLAIYFDSLHRFLLKVPKVRVKRISLSLCSKQKKVWQVTKKTDFFISPTQL